MTTTTLQQAVHLTRWAWAFSNEII